MTRVDFYILQQDGPEARAKFACRLAEKAWQQGHSVYIHANDEQQARHLDDLLWSFSDGSFLPHQLMAEAEAAEGARQVYIGWGEPAETQHDVLINLADQLPGFFSRFERLAEILDGDDKCRSAGRERFRFYRDRGYPLETHEI